MKTLFLSSALMENHSSTTPLLLLLCECVKFFFGSFLCLLALDDDCCFVRFVFDLLLRLGLPVHTVLGRNLTGQWSRYFSCIRHCTSLDWLDYKKSSN